jgi:hypothetical protein
MGAVLRGGLRSPVVKARPPEYARPHVPIATLRMNAAPTQGRDTTPAATKLALAAAVVVTAGALGGFALARGTVPAGFCASFLTVFTVLFFLRVAGQLVVVACRPGWLPPGEKWNLTPYRLLLPAQLAILGVMAWIDIAFWAGSGPPVRPHQVLGEAVLWFAAVYAAAMALRYVVRMARRPEERWFGGTIPIVFHWVLAAYLVVFGTFHASH